MKAYRNEEMVLRVERNAALIIAAVLFVFALHTCSKMMEYRQAEIQNHQGGEVNENRTGLGD